MKRVIGAAALLAVCLSVNPGTAGAQQAAAAHKVAPADEYFGPLKMSFLGIRNEIHDLMLRYDAEPDKRDAFFGMAVQTETSLKDWESKYPRDSAIPRQIYFLRFLYDKFDRYEAQLKRDATDKWLLTRYGNTWYAKDVKKKLASATPRPPASDAPASVRDAAASAAASPGAQQPAAQPPAAAPAPAAVPTPAPH
jgi:hypothetical protein